MTTFPEAAPVRVASVPFSQVYIRHCGPLPGEPEPFVRLQDPRPRRGDGTEQSGWWPPAMLEPGWIDEHRDDFDLMHVHFGFDALGPDDLRRVVADLRRHGKPLVYTVHDLTNPHHTTPEAHDAALDVLVRSADALVTLTPGAASAIRERWGRDALVLPHPHVVPLEELRARQARPRERGEVLRLGLHLKSLRPNMAAVPMVEGLVAAARALEQPAVVQVNAHPDVMGETGRRRDPELPGRLAALDEQGAIELRVEPYFDEDALWDYLSSLDASVLPYRWGTHSGWLEACSDLGTAVVAPDCGFYAEQRPVHGFHLGRDGLDVDSLAAAVASVAATPPGANLLPVEQRVQERRRVCAAHAELYRGLLGG